MLNEAAARNNLRYAGWDEVEAPSGERWRVGIVRPDESSRSWANLWLVALALSRLRRALRRDRRWRVEVVAPNASWQYASVAAFVDGRDAAIDRAICAMRDIHEGRGPGDRPGERRSGGQ